MGCFESRPKVDADNFHTLSTAFVGGANEPNLGPIDSFDHVFRDQLDGNTYGTWE